MQQFMKDTKTIMLKGHEVAFEEKLISADGKITTYFYVTDSGFVNEITKGAYPDAEGTVISLEFPADQICEDKAIAQVSPFREHDNYIEDYDIVPIDLSQECLEALILLANTVIGIRKLDKLKTKNLSADTNEVDERFSNYSKEELSSYLKFTRDLVKNLYRDTKDINHVEDISEYLNIISTKLFAKQSEILLAERKLKENNGHFKDVIELIYANHSTEIKHLSEYTDTFGMHSLRFWGNNSTLVLLKENKTNKGYTMTMLIRPTKINNNKQAELYPLETPTIPCVILHGDGSITLKAILSDPVAQFEQIYAKLLNKVEQVTELVNSDWRDSIVLESLLHKVMSNS